LVKVIAYIKNIAKLLGHFIATFFVVILLQPSVKGNTV